MRMSTALTIRLRWFPLIAIGVAVLAVANGLGLAAGLRWGRHPLTAVAVLSPPVLEAAGPSLVEYRVRPLTFEANVGQTDRRVNFLSRGQGYTLFLAAGEAVLRLPRQGATIRMNLLGASPVSTPSGLDALPGKVNFLRGNRPAAWRSGIPTYGKAKYDDVYPGVDLVYYGSQGHLEYDFIVAPHVDPGVIVLAIDGTEGATIDGGGDLVMRAGEAVLRLAKPVVYQDVDGIRREIAGRYVVEEAGRRVRFKVAAYDVTRPLVIDPVFLFSTVLGGSADDAGYAIAVDRAGNAYVTGAVNSSDFPLTKPAQRASAGSTDAFVAKLSRDGQVLYATYLGGSGSDVGYAIAVDAAGYAYIAGDTRSADFPVVNPVQRGLGGSADAFVAKLSPDGSQLVYATYFGGAAGERAQGIAVDPVGNAYVVGFTNSANFPLVNPFHNVYDRSAPATGFVMKLNAAGRAIVYSTYLGGKGPAPTIGTAIAVDPGGNAYVTGYTNAPDFPILNPIQPFGGANNPLGGQTDVFVTKLNPDGSGLSYSTFLGGPADDEGRGIAVDAEGHAYVTGHTESLTFPTTPGAFRTSCVPRSSQIPIGPVCLGGDAFVAKLSRDGRSLVYSTYIAGSEHEVGQAIAVDADGNAYVAGVTNSKDFPTANAAQATYGGGQFDAFVVKLDPRGAALTWGTYLGGTGSEAAYGIAVDAERNVHVTGFTNSTDFSTRSPSRAAPAPAKKAFVVKIGERGGPQPPGR